MTKSTNFMAAKEFSRFGANEKALGRRESASGPGSSLEASVATRRLLRMCIDEMEVRSILDLGCGDWNWMREVSLRSQSGSPVTYRGWEAEESLVSELNAEFGNETTAFSCADIVVEEFPKVDLILARDVLFHLPTEMTLRILEKVRESTGLFMSTSFPGVLENTGIESYNDIDDWGFYKINLNVMPFDLVENLKVSFLEEGNSHSGNIRHICLYDFEFER